MTEPHEVLGLRPGATRAEVIAAFRRFALRNHPDRGGDPDRFDAGVEAYRRLLGAPPSSTAGATRPDVVFHRRRHRSRNHAAALGALLRRARLVVARSRP